MHGLIDSPLTNPIAAFLIALNVAWDKSWDLSGQFRRNAKMTTETYEMILRAGKKAKAEAGEGELHDAIDAAMEQAGEIHEAGWWDHSLRNLARIARLTVRGIFEDQGGRV